MAYKLNKKIPHLKIKIGFFIVIFVSFFGIAVYLKGYGYLKTMIADLTREEEKGISQTPYTIIREYVGRNEELRNITDFKIYQLDASRYLAVFLATTPYNNVLSPYKYILNLEEENGVLYVKNYSDEVIYLAKEANRSKKDEQPFYIEFKNIGNVFWDTKDEWADSSDSAPLELVSKKEGKTIISPGETGIFRRKRIRLPGIPIETLYPKSITSNFVIIVERKDE